MPTPSNTQPDADALPFIPSPACPLSPLGGGSNISLTPRRMRVAVFALDYTIWQPEMYQLWGPPKLVPVQKKHKLSEAVLLEARTNQEGHVLMDRDGSPIRVFRGA